jgi:FkbM family methyltransferase
MEKKNYPYIKEYKHVKPGFDFWVPNEFFHSWYGSSDEQGIESKETYKLVSSKDNVLEIGCNIGVTTLELRNIVGPMGYVVGVDITPTNIMYSHANIGLNMFDNVEVHCLGAGSSVGKLKILPRENGRVALEGDDYIEIDVFTGDILMEYCPDGCDVLKIDVEGFEVEVLKGCRKLLKRKPKLLLEVHGSLLKNYNATLNDIYDLLEIDNYEGTMYVREFDLLLEFSRENLEKYKDEVVNLFLKSKS